jgi:tripeptide aminopeptidase
MKGQINKERLGDLFTSLCEIDSPSKQEGRVATRLKEIFAGLGADAILEDDSASQTGSDCGNLLVRFIGSLDRQPVFFNCHMDTVEPGVGVKVRRQGDTFFSAGDTVLGADDKSGIAIFIEVMRTLQENKIAHGPVEFLFTTCEEIGLRGVKSLNFPSMRAKIGYALDTTGIDRIVFGAPAANRLVIEIAGLAAHAGLNPEKGINAIQLSAQAIARLDLGRLDEESTANIGLITGGTATNIIPDNVVIQGEVRSHSESKLAAYTEDIRNTFEQTVQDWSGRANGGGQPTLTFSVNKEYPVMQIKRDDPVRKRIEEAATGLNRKLLFTVAGGGSDANILCSQGRPCLIIGTGMNNVHTTEESIDLQDMVRTAELVMGILAIRETD